MLKSTMKASVVVAFAWLALHVACAAQAAEWGSIKGRILIDGKPAALAPINAGTDPFCAMKKPVSETIVVGKDNALVNAVVYLRLATGKKVEIHPEYDAAFKKAVDLDNKNCAFIPHVTLVRVGQTLNVKNSDPVGHNTNVAAFSFNQVIPAGATVPVKASVAGPLPSNVACNIHPFMKAWLLCLDHPYMAVADNDGKFEIKNIPVGEHEFQFWHEAAGYLKTVKMKGAATDARGRAKLKIAAGATLDLGDIKVPAGVLKTQ
jgi:hypothetical protein